MKKFTQYLKPPKDKKELSLTEKVWLDAKKKIEEDNKQAELTQLEEKQKEEEPDQKFLARIDNALEVISPKAIIVSHTDFILNFMREAIGTSFVEGITCVPNND